MIEDQISGPVTERLVAVCRDLRTATAAPTGGRTARPALGRVTGVEGPLQARAEPSAGTDSLADLLIQLRAVTAGYVRALRDAGARPETMLVRVKALAAEALAAEGWRDPEVTTVLTQHVVRWGVAAYYSSDGR